MRVRIATRGSPLARWQAERVGALLHTADPSTEVELVIVETLGDVARDRPIHELGGQGVFVKEVQAAVLDGHADVAVHSAKDLPSTPAPGLVIAAVPERGDPRDALVGRALGSTRRGSDRCDGLGAPAGAARPSAPRPRVRRPEGQHPDATDEGALGRSDRDGRRRARTARPVSADRRGPRSVDHAPAGRAGSSRGGVSRRRPRHICTAATRRARAEPFRDRWRAGLPRGARRRLRPARRCPRDRAGAGVAMRRPRRRSRRHDRLASRRDRGRAVRAGCTRRAGRSSTISVVPRCWHGPRLPAWPTSSPAR